MRLQISILISILTVVSASSQNYIGMTKEQLIQAVEKNNTSFNLDDGVKNNTYNYVKFSDKNNEETWLFFLNDKNICTHHKMMSDYSNLNSRVDEFNKKYTKAIKDVWVFVDKGVSYKVEIKRDEWFFSVLTHKN